jgi:hypothetical protein
MSQLSDVFVNSLLQVYCGICQQPHLCNDKGANPLSFLKTLIPPFFVNSTSVIDS